MKTTGGSDQLDEDLRVRIARLEADRRHVRWWRVAATLAIALGVSAPIAVDALGPVPHTFSSGDVISASRMNENFRYLQDAITSLEQLPTNRVVVRKATGSAAGAIAFCETDETLVGGGCFLPPENDYDADYADHDVYHTGDYPRAMVGLTSVPVSAGTTLGELRPRHFTHGRVIPFPGDIIAGDTGSAVVEPGAGWACRPGTVDFDDGAGAQPLVNGRLYEGWYWHVKAYAVCMGGE